jgi:hypothetical protein
LLEGGDDARMTMALVQRGVGGEAIQVAIAVDVPDIHTLAPTDNEGQWVVVVGTPPFHFAKEIVSCLGFAYRGFWHSYILT